MPNKDQKKRYTKIENNINTISNKKNIKLKNWQKILILVLLIVLCIGVIILMTYLIIR